MNGLARKVNGNKNMRRRVSGKERKKSERMKVQVIFLCGKALKSEAKEDEG